jgi:TnpA family transposase|tara:strand:- start:25494 stop:28562 length:3069 start_codon:yes stop_codon:yes gene_type:complete
MTRLVVLPPAERARFDSPPKLSSSARIHYFALNRQILNILNKLKAHNNKIGFLLQLGHFKASGKFFSADQFSALDVHFVACQLKIPATKINLSNYNERTALEHRSKILQMLSWKPYADKQKHTVLQHIKWFVERQLSPKQVFISTVDICLQSKIEIPSYNILAVSISDAYNKFEQDLLVKLNKVITNKKASMLNKLISGNEDMPLQRPPLTLLKNINQSLRPSEIQENVAAFNKIKDCYDQFENIIDILSLSEHANEYLATWVQKAKTFQLNQFRNKCKSYLYFLAYIKHQLYIRNDVLVDIFLKSVKSAENTAHKQLNEHEACTRKDRNKAIRTLSDANKDSRIALKSIADIIGKKTLSKNEQLTQITQVINAYHNKHDLKNTNQVEELEKSLTNISKNQSYYDKLEGVSVRLQRRINSIFKSITFDPKTSDQNLLDAIEYLKERDGKLTQIPPLKFLKNDEIEVLRLKKYSTSLYKVLLFIHVADGIKSGKLNLLYSYRYKAIQNFLIDEKLWKKDRKQLIKSAGLEGFKDAEQVLSTLKNKLNEKYSTVNERILNNENKDVTVDENYHIKINTPRKEKEDNELISALLSDNSFTPILKVLDDVNDVTRFTDCFKHFSIKHKKAKPKKNTIYAGILGKGCNIGINRIANTSVGMSENVLQNTVNWCFDLKNIQDANNKIISMTDKLFLARSYRSDEYQNHTSSDGTKINVSTDCLHANYSFKYFGKGKGVAMYTFVDEQQVLFHSTVISASEREAPYVLDGLLKNEVIKSTIHSTDTHGFTETIFAAVNMIGVSFAPRLSKITNQTIYSFVDKATYIKQGYKILPSRRINQKLIIDNWDDILRFIVTIKLRHSTASQLFTRLSSYAKEHPLYKSLKELGRIYKSLFILSYYDDSTLRQKIEKQLNKVELSHKFSKAVFFANNREFKTGDKTEQKIAAACKSLIQNSIILWNYLYLSEYITNIPEPKDRAKIVSTVQQGSMMTWQHVNLHGEYDFTRRASNSPQFDLAKIIKLDIHAVSPD